MLAEVIPFCPLTREVRHATYCPVVPLASSVRAFRPRLYPRRFPTLRPVGHWPRPQRRRTHHYPVPHRPRPTGGLEAFGEFRRDRSLEPGPRRGGVGGPPRRRSG